MYYYFELSIDNRTLSHKLKETKKLPNGMKLCDDDFLSSLETKKITLLEANKCAFSMESQLQTFLNLLKTQLVTAKQEKSKEIKSPKKNVVGSKEAKKTIDDFMPFWKIFRQDNQLTGKVFDIVFQPGIYVRADESRLESAKRGEFVGDITRLVFTSKQKLNEFYKAYKKGRKKKEV